MVMHPFSFYARPMTDRPGCDFSFSGLKTQVLTEARRLVKTDQLNDQAKADLAASFQRAVVDTLVIKCERALVETGARALVMSGGVSANRLLRQTLKSLQTSGIQVAYPAPEFCTDNGAMIAFAGLMRLSRTDLIPHSVSQIRPRWPLSELRRCRNGYDVCFETPAFQLIGVYLHGKRNSAAVIPRLGHQNFTSQMPLSLMILKTRLIMVRCAVISRLQPRANTVT